MQRRNIEKLLIQKFNAEARPLSSGALHSLAEFVQESNQPASQAVQELLSQLTIGTPFIFIAVYMYLQHRGAEDLTCCALPGEHPTITAEDVDSLIRKVEDQDSQDDFIQVGNWALSCQMLRVGYVLPTVLVPMSAGPKRI